VPPVIGAIVLLAETIGPAIASAFAATAAFLGVSTATLAITAITAVGGIIMRSLMPKPDLGSFTQESQDRSLTVRSPIQPWRIVYGEVGKLGGALLLFERSSDNAYLHIVVVYACHQVDAFTEFYLDDKLVTFTTGGAGAYDPATGSYAGYVWKEQHLGDPADTTQPFPQLAADLPAKWGSSHLARGRAKVHWKIKLDNNVFPNGVPQPRVSIRGKLVYDPRTATTAYSNNAALVARDWATWSLGLRIPTSDFPDSYVIAAANSCDELVAISAGNGGGTEKRYMANGSVTTDSDRKQVMEGILSAMMGDLVPIGKEWRLFAGVWRAPTAATITESDFRGEFSWNGMVPRDQLFNAVKGVYVSAANNWQPSDFPAVLNATYEAQDGERIFSDISLPFTTSGTCAQRLAKIVLEDHRRPGNGTLPLKLTTLDVCAPDNIALNFASFGWVGKTLRVKRSRFAVEQGRKGPVYGVDLEVKEIDANVFAWSTSNETSLAASGTSSTGDNSVVQPVTSLTATSGSATAITNSDGIKQPRVKLTWNAPADQLVTSGGKIQIGYKLHTDTAYTWITAKGNATLVMLIGLSAGSVCDFRVIAVNRAGGESAAVDITSYTVSGDISNITTSQVFASQGSAVPNVQTQTPFAYGIGTQQKGYAVLQWEDVGQTDVSALPAYGGSVAITKSTKDTDGGTRPAAPTLSAVSSGSKFARTQYARVALVRKGPDGTPFLAGISAESTLALSAGQLLRVTSPANPGTGWDGWIPLVAYDYSGATKQNFVAVDPSTPIAFGTDWTEGTGEINQASILSSNNMDIELGNANYWARISGTSHAASTTQKHSGTYSLKITGAGGSTVQIDHCTDAAATNQEYLSTSVGDVIKIGFWLYGETVSGTTVTLRLMDSTPSVLGSVAISNPAAGWNYYEVTRLIATASDAHLQITIASTGAFAIYVDDLVFKKMNGATKYADFEGDVNAPRYGLVMVNLPAGTAYKVYPHYDLNLSRVNAASEQSSSVNKSKNQLAYRDGRIPMMTSLTPIGFTVPSIGGASGGGTGGTTGCQKEGSIGVSFQFAEGAEYEVRRSPAEDWCRVMFTNDQERHVTPRHRYRTKRGLVPAAALRPGDEIFNVLAQTWWTVRKVETYVDRDGIAIAVEIKAPGAKLSDVDDGHHYGAGELESHNVKA
jgi:hypothetical protein